jgi:hypothetical protein
VETVPSATKCQKENLVFALCAMGKILKVENAHNNLKCAQYNYYHCIAFKQHKLLKKKRLPEGKLFFFLGQIQKLLVLASL